MRISPIHHLAAVLAVLLISTTVHATAGAPGTLDPFWGTGSALGPGKVMTPVGSGNDQAFAVALQPDGKVVLAGSCLSGAFTAFCAVRYNTDGTLDLAFNGTGKVITVIGASTANAEAKAVVVQPDGGLVLAGACSNGTNTDFCALRYLSSGSLDLSFGSGGKVITAIGGDHEYANALLLQPDGKLVLAGYCRAANTSFSFFCAQRLLANGAPDPGFGNPSTGSFIVLPSIGSASKDRVTAVALQSDGKLVFVGGCNSLPNDTNFCASRHHGNGTFDTTFNGSGKVITPVAPLGALANAIALQPDGKLVLAGECFLAFGGAEFCTARYLANGALDPSFGIGGTVITRVGDGSDHAQTVIIQPDGKLVLAGYCGTSPRVFCALRYHANGRVLDTTFNSIGTLGTPVGSGEDFANAIALQTDGKLILVGGCSTGSNGSNSDFCAVRYDGGPFGYKNCSLDIDGDNRFTATIDGLINMRVMLGITGPAVVSGITFPANATRNTWPLIRDYLVSQCGMSLQL